MATVARPRSSLPAGAAHRAALPSGPMVDDGGEVTSQWRGFFQALFSRTGGGVGSMGVFYGTGAPTFTAPIGTLYSQTDGTIGATLYVSAGGGTWNSVAGV
jgi:hypothetical protein